MATPNEPKPAAIAWPVQLVIVDAETTGLDPVRHGIHDFAIHHPASGNSGTWFIDPRPCEIDPVSLEVGGVTVDHFDQPFRQEVHGFLEELDAWLAGIALPEGAKFVLCGRNPGFDRRMLEGAAIRAAWPQERRERFWKRISHRQLDTHGAMYALAIALGWEWPTGTDKTEALYARLGQVPELEPHKAWTGVLQAAEGLQRIVRRIQHVAAPEEAPARSVENDPRFLKE